MEGWSKKAATFQEEAQAVQLLYMPEPLVDASSLEGGLRLLHEFLARDKAQLEWRRKYKVKLPGGRSGSTAGEVVVVGWACEGGVGAFACTQHPLGTSAYRPGLYTA
jgi:hypothetical protein